MAKVCCASPGRFEEKSTALPSGVKLDGFSSCEYQVRRFASPPVAGTAKMFIGPKRSAAKAMVELSGDQTGVPE